MARHHVTSPYAEGAPRPAAGPPPRVPVVSQYLVLASAVATTALLAAAGLVATVQADALHAWWDTTSPQNDTVDLLNLLGGLTALTNVIAFVATGRWLLDVRRVADRAPSPSLQRRSPYWAVLGWVVPVVNLWFPYQVVADASRGVGSRVRTFWPWWIAWLALTYYSFVGTSGGELVTEADLSGWIRAHQVGAVIALVACVLWWRVVRSATQGAEATAKGD